MGAESNKSALAKLSFMIVIKIGGSAITDKKGVEKARKARIKEIAKVIADSTKKSRQKIILVHGAGSFGHPQVIKYKIADGVHTEKQEIGFAKTHASVLKLSYLLMREFEKNGMKVCLFSPLHFILQEKGKIKEFDARLVMRALEKGITPLLHGDVVFDTVLGGSVCSGDKVVSYLGRKAKRVIFITEVDGILDKKGRTIRKIGKGDLEKLKGVIGKARGHDVTGGMGEKLKEIMKIGKPAYIIGAGNLKGIERLILGEEEKKCTRISA